MADQSSWQCPGCGTMYMLHMSCTCQTRYWTKPSDSTLVAPESPTPVAEGPVATLLKCEARLRVAREDLRELAKVAGVLQADLTRMADLL